MSDGHFSGFDYVGFIKPLMSLPAALEGWKLVKEELADLDDNEEHEIKELVKKTTGYDDVTMAGVNTMLDWVWETNNMLSIFIG